ncbi:DUF6705 family protein [Chryseobacterium arthrosphaerae]|uniref:DUF6705 family protein n=1 Tax=Chryseobacterium arthrosphaerae TaxID=651561 RepID=UPI001BAF678F|nr:DUF6705 family protein [Chryseobacterium arthrosphaerae]QUY54740.1 hypothetical protein I2F65_17935 [Chryseobacterium arthrosphaerae]
MNKICPLLKIKNIIIIICFAIFTSCIGQTVSLETMAQCSQFENCPNATYVKDINNSLNKYTGTWKGTRDGKNYEFNFIKKEKIGETKKWDMLIGRVKITNANGIVEYDNFNKPDSETRFNGYNFQKNLKMYLMNFSGGKPGCIDYGYAYLNIKPGTPDKMTISFLSDNDIVTQDCSNFQTTLPNNKVIPLTKQ